MKLLRSRALNTKEAKRILDTTQHSLNHELSDSSMSEAYDLADGGVLLLFEDGRGRLYESRDELRAMLDEAEQRARQGPVSPCRDLPQGHAFAEQVPELVRQLPAHLHVDATQLDGTEASLDAVDKALHRMQHRTMLKPDIFAALTAYVGEVIRNVTKGRWEMLQGTDSEQTWEPWIVDPSGRSYAPFKIYKELLEYGRSGSMRVFVQWELSHGMQPRPDIGQSGANLSRSDIGCRSEPETRRMLEIRMNSSVNHQSSETRVRYVLAAGSVALAGSLWGTGFLFGKIAMRQMTVGENVSFRFLTAAILLAPVVIRSWRPYRGTELGLLLLASGIGVPVQFLVQFQGLRLTTVSHASLIVGVLPVLVAAVSALVLQERLRAIEWMVPVVSAAGALLIGLSSHAQRHGAGPSLRGDVLVMLSMFAAVVMTLCSKRLIATHGPLHVTATTLMLGTVCLFACVEVTHPLRFQFSPTAWGAAVAQGVLATAGAYLLLNWGLLHMPAGRAGVFLNLEPVVGTILGVSILHERLAPLAMLGGVLIVGAAVYFSLHPHESENRPIFEHGW